RDELGAAAYRADRGEVLLDDHGRGALVLDEQHPDATDQVPFDPRSHRGSIPALSASRDDARLKAFTESCYVARPCKPYTGRLRVLQAVPERGAQAPQAERLAENVGVNRDIHHERVPLALLHHLVELVDDHVGELGCAAAAMHDVLRVVELDRVRN